MSTRMGTESWVGDAARPGGRFPARVRPMSIQVITLSWKQRGLALAAGVGALGVIALARLVAPDPRGLGTHERLGLPPCLSEALFHIPCPFCGMTTAFSLMAHGRVQEAFVCQPAGALSFVGVSLASVAAWWCCIAAVGLRIRLSRAQSRMLWATGLGLIILAWIYKLLKVYC